MAETIILKFCFGNLLLPWVVKNFDISSVLLVRHPCAVVASQLAHNKWKLKYKDGFHNTEGITIPKSFRNSRYFDHYEEVLTQAKQPEEELAAFWAINIHHNINHKNNNLDWITTSYEKLVLEPEKELHYIFDRIVRPIPKNLFDNILKPSKTAFGKDVNFKKNTEQLKKWQKTLSSKQINNIMGILKEFGIDYYSKEIEPSYNCIYNTDKGGTQA